MSLYTIQDGKPYAMAPIKNMVQSEDSVLAIVMIPRRIQATTISRRALRSISINA